MFDTCASSFGQLLAAFAPNYHIAGLLIPMAFAFVALFCGLQPLLQPPKFWHLVHYASPFSRLLEYVPFPHTTKMLMPRRGPMTLFPHLQDLGCLGFGS
jgi:hypothetical protein